MRPFWMRLTVICLLASVVSNSAAMAQGISTDDDYAYDGFTEPAEDILVAAVEIGRIERVHVKVGDRVEVGQELATLENTLQLFAIEYATHQTLKKGDLEAAIAERTRNLTRTEQLHVLFQSGGARPDELKRAETDLLVADARVMVATEDQMERSLELKRQEVQLDRRRVVSPIAGIVAKIMRRSGEYISPGDMAIVRVISKDSLVAVFNLPVQDALRLQVGQTIPLRPRSVPRLVEGIVESIAPAIDGESGTVAIRLRIDNRDEALLPGDRCVMNNVKNLSQAHSVLAPSEKPKKLTR